MKSIFGLLGLSLLLVYFFGAPFHAGPSKQVRISDLTALSEKGLTPDELSKVFVAQASSTYPNQVISGNSPNMYTAGNNPNTVIQGNSPNVLTRGNFPDRYTMGGFNGNPDSMSFPMPKVNF